MLDSISSSFSNAFKKLKGKGKLSSSDIESVLVDIRQAFVDADVAVSVTDSFLDGIREKTADIEQSKSITPAQQIIKVISDELEDVLGKDTERNLNRAKRDSGPTVYMLIGLQGAGKTTLAGKLAHFLKQNGHTPLLVAADLQRPGAVDQLEIVGKNVKVPVFAPNRGMSLAGESQKKEGLAAKLFGSRDTSKEPVKVAKDSIDEAKRKLYDTVIIDTAGRLGVDEELLSQASQIKSAVNPDEVLFVLDSTTGQDAVNSATAFDEKVGFTGSILTKMDSDSRGGVALSLAKVTNKPILFSSTGEKTEDLEVFHPDRVASRILDQGDILTLLETAEAKIDEEVIEKATKKLIEGEDFDLNDFLDQMAQIKKMGSLKNVMNMLPGMGQYKQAIDNFDEGELTRIESIIFSMTPFERANPRKIDGSRKQRIARGSGVEVSAVNMLLDRFTQMQKTMKQMMGGKKGKKFKQMAMADEQDSDDLSNFDMSDLAGMLPPGFNSPLSGHGSGKSSSNKRKSKSKKRGSKSGNPAKRAAEMAALRDRLG